jgi:HD-like signal output (HDOD) protein
MFARDDLIREAQKLDPLPASSARLSQILSKEDWSLDEIAKTVALDQALTGRILRAANSASSGSQQRISSASNAVMRLGPSLVLSISLGQGIQSQMKDEEALWRHSIGAALATEAMRRVGLRPPPGTFIAALVHDVGKLVIRRRLKRTGITIASKYPDEPWRDESDQLGIDHAELTASIARTWELPEGIPEAVENHHHPHALEEGQVQKMAQFVAAADAITHALDDEEPRWNPVITAHLGIGAEDQEKVRTMTAKVLEQVMKLYA